MASITTEGHVEIDLGGEVHRIDTSATFQTGDEIIDVVVSIAFTATVTLWEAATSLLDEFAFAAFVLLSEWDDEDSGTRAVVDLEFTVDDGGNEQNDTKRLVYNTPLILGADDAYDNQGGNDLLGASTLDVIEKIRANNPGQNSAVDVRMILIK